MPEGHVDGNALAGPLSELFEFDVTMTSARCSSCADVSLLAQAMVYEKPHTFIVRCSNCGEVLMLVLQKSDATEIELGGIDWLRAPR